MDIQIFSDIACPFCYLGLRRLKSALAEFEHAEHVNIQMRSYQLDPTLPEEDSRSEVEYLTQTKGMPVEQVEQMTAQISAQATAEGLEFDFENLVVANSWKAHRVMQRARAIDPAIEVRLEEHLLAAHFEQGKSISRDEMLVEAGTACGMTQEQVHEALTEQQWDDAVKADIAQARALGIQGVPFFILDQKYAVSGAQPKELFLQALNKAWAERQPAFTMVGGEELNGQACGPEGCD